MAQPGALALRILTRFDECCLTCFIERQGAPQVLADRAIARRVPRRGVLRNLCDQSSHFVHPAFGKHLVQSRRDPVGERWSRIDHKIASNAVCWAGACAMKRAHTLPGQERDLDRAKELRSAEMSTIRIEDTHPASQFGQGQWREYRFEMASTRRLEDRF